MRGEAVTLPKKIDQMYAWIVTEENGQEGIPAYCVRTGQWLPMVGADTERIESLRDTAMGIALAKGLPIKLVKFSGIEILESHDN